MSQNRKTRRAQAAKSRKAPMNRPPSEQKPTVEYTGIAAYVLTCRALPQSLLDAVQQAVAAGNAIYLYPRVDTYSVSMRPLEFGAALCIHPLQHTGQLKMSRIYNEIEAVPVETEELGFITTFEEMQTAWENTFDMVWTVDETELPAPLELAGASPAESGDNTASDTAPQTEE